MSRWMSDSWKAKLKKYSLLSLSIPAVLCIISAILPLKPVIQQAFVGVMLIWFQVTALLSSNNWFH